MMPPPLPPSQDIPPPVQAMSLDEARALLVREHGVAIGADDPVLMLVTLHQGFVRDHAALLDRQSAAVRQVLAEADAAYATGIAKMLDGMKDKTVQAAIDTAFGVVSHQARELEAFGHQLRRHRRSLIALTVLAWLAALAVAALLALILK